MKIFQKNWKSLYGIRLFYSPAALKKISIAIAFISILFYIARAVQQFIGLDNQVLLWDFQQFYTAAITLAHGQDPYQTFLSSCPVHHWCSGGYIFPPLLAEVLYPFTFFSLLTASKIWLILCHVIFGLTIFLVYKGFGEYLTTTQKGILLFGTLLFLPLYESLYFLQVGIILLFLITLAAVEYVRRKNEISSGIFMGVASILRVTPIIMLPLYLRQLQRKKKPLGLISLIITAAILCIILLILTPYTAKYFSIVLPRIGTGTQSLDNISFPAVIDRISYIYTGDISLWATVFSALLGISFIGYTWLKSLKVEESPINKMLIFAAFLAVLPIISSITWRHHLVTELLVFVLITPSLYRHKIALKLVVLSYFLLWIDRHITDGVNTFLFGSHSMQYFQDWRIAPFLLITSCNLIGMLLLWWITIILLNQSKPPPNKSDS